MPQQVEFTQIEVADSVATISMNRPSKLNALNRQMVKSISAALADAIADPAVRAIVLIGNGKAFAAGADISEYADASPRDLDQFTALCNRLCRDIADSEKPVVAAVAGLALGGGFELALCCDFIVASDSARFGLPEVELGLLPGWGGTQRLTQLIGPNRAKSLIITGGRLTADDALNLGIAYTVTTDDGLRATAHELARVISDKAPLAVGAIKNAVNRALASGDGNAGAGYEIEQAHLRRLFLTADGREGVQAFVEKRQARFVGR